MSTRGGARPGDPGARAPPAGDLALRTRPAGPRGPARRRPRPAPCGNGAGGCSAWSAGGGAGTRRGRRRGHASRPAAPRPAPRRPGALPVRVRRRRRPRAPGGPRPAGPRRALPCVRGRRRVVGSDPPAGTPYDDGDPITVHSSVGRRRLPHRLPGPGDGVAADRLRRAPGPCPDFAARVFLYPGDGPPVILDRATAQDPDAWLAGVLEGCARRRSRWRWERPSAVVRRPGDPRRPDRRQDRRVRGAPPAVAGSVDAFALEVRPPGRTGCPLRLDVFREAARSRRWRTTRPRPDRSTARRCRRRPGAVAPRARRRRRTRSSSARPTGSR